MSTNDLAAMDAFLAEARNAVVIGIRADGRPHATPNWFLWEDGKFYVSTTTSRAKYRIFRNDPRGQLVIDDATGFRYIVVEGTVHIETDVDGGIDTFAKLRAKHGRGGQSRDELRDELVRDGRVLLVLTPSKPQAAWTTMGF